MNVANKICVVILSSAVFILFGIIVVFTGLYSSLNVNKINSNILLQSYGTYTEIQQMKQRIHSLETTIPVTDKIDVSSLCSGDGSSSNSWILNESVLITAIKSLTNTTKTIWFKTGHYYSSSTIHIDFGQIFKDNPNKYSLFREGLSIIGDTNTK
eukprot:250041_1